VNKNNEICRVCLEPVKRTTYKTGLGKTVCAGCVRQYRNCFACDEFVDKERALRFSDGRYVCSECARGAVYEFDAKQLAKIKRRLAWFPEMPIAYKVVSKETLPKRRRRTPLNLGRSKPICENHGNQLLIVSHEIEILIGLPRELHEAIVVHELFHAWLHEHFTDEMLDKKDAEWLCSHMSLLYLRACRAKKPWRKIIKAGREQYLFKHAADFKDKVSWQIIHRLLREAKKKQKRSRVC